MASIEALLKVLQKGTAMGTIKCITALSMLLNHIFVCTRLIYPDLVGMVVVYPSVEGDTYSVAFT